MTNIKKIQTSKNNKSREYNIFNPWELKDKLTPFLKVKSIRTTSGIVEVAVICKPHYSPHILLTGNK